MDENEVSVTFFVDKELMRKFEVAKDEKAKTLGIKLTKKQALQLAMKDAISAWTKEKPESI
jgi:hypothetical protein